MSRSIDRLHHPSRRSVPVVHINVSITVSCSKFIIMSHRLVFLDGRFLLVACPSSRVACYMSFAASSLLSGNRCLLLAVCCVFVTACRFRPLVIVVPRCHSVECRQRCLLVVAFGCYMPFAPSSLLLGACFLLLAAWCVPVAACGLGSWEIERRWTLRILKMWSHEDLGVGGLEDLRS